MLHSVRELRHTHVLGDSTLERVVVRSRCAALDEAGIWAAGLSDAGRGYVMTRVQPNFEQLLVCTGGEGMVLVDGRWRRCGAGQAYLCPLQVTSAFRTRPRQRWQFCWILYEQPRPGQLPVIGGDRPRLVNADPRGVWASVEGLHQEAMGPGEAAMMDRWLLLMQAQSARILDPYHERDPLWQLWAAVTEDLSADWSAERIAERACLSAEQVRRLSLRHTGRSPIEHVTHLRMERAAMLLESTPMKIGAIARAMGYSNPFAFSTAFRRAKGICPADWRAARMIGRAPHE